MNPADPPLQLPESLTDCAIVLDAHTLDDAVVHLAGEDDEMRRRFESPGPATLEQVRAAIGRWIAARAMGGPMIAYAMRQPSGPLIGGCEIRRTGPDRASVSYWTFPAHRGRGYAARALTLLCAAAAEVPGLALVEAHIDPDNLASRRTAERANFAEAGSVADEALDGSSLIRLLYILPIRRRSAG